MWCHGCGACLAALAGAFLVRFWVWTERSVTSLLDFAGRQPGDMHGRRNRRRRPPLPLRAFWHCTSSQWTIAWRPVWFQVAKSQSDTLPQEAAGIDWARANDGLAQLRAAFWIADHLRRIRSSLTRDLGFGDGLSKRSRLETDDVWLLALQAWRFARLRQGGGWHGILGLGTMPRPRDPAWDRGRHKDGALPEAAGEASGSEDESPNKDGVLSPMEEWDALWEGVPLRITKLTDVSDETLGEAYRTKALERPVGLIDRALSIAAESRSEHVGPDYNRIDVHTDLTPRGDDAKWRQEAVEYAKESADYFEKAGYLAKSARSMLEAALLASPDSEKRKDLRKEADSRRKKARKKPHADFNNLEPYFQLIGAFMDNKLWDKGATDLEELSHDLQQTGHWYLAGIVDEIKARLDNIQEV